MSFGPSRRHTISSPRDTRLYGDEHLMSHNDADPARARLSFLDRPLSPAFALAVVELLPGDERWYDPSEWEDSIVVVESGAVVLEGRAGSRRFESGDVLLLAGLGLRALRNPGAVPAVLSSVRRRRPGEAL